MKKIFIIVLLIFISNTISLGQNNIHDKLFPVFDGYDVTYVNIKGEQIYGNIDLSSRFVCFDYVEDRISLGWYGFIYDDNVIDEIRSINAFLPSDLYFAGPNTYINKDGIEIIKGEEDQCIYPIIDKSGEYFAIIEPVQDPDIIAESYIPGIVEIIDKNSKIIIPKGRYQSINMFSLNGEMTLCVKLNNKCGIIKLNGEEIYPTIFDYISVGSITNNAIVFGKEFESYYKKDDYECKLASGLRWGNAKNISSNMLRCLSDINDELQGYIDLNTGKQIIPFKYKYLGHFSDDLAIASKNGRDFFYIDKKNNTIFSTQINLSQDIALSETFDAYSFNNGAAVFYKNGKYGLVDKQGKKIIQAQYDLLIPVGSLFIAESNSKRGAINSHGEIIIPLSYDNIVYNATKDEYEVMNGYKKGIYKTTGEVILPCKYMHVVNIYDSIYCVANGQGFYGCYDSEKQTEIIGCRYRNQKEVTLEFFRRLRSPNEIDVDENIPQISKAKDNTFAFIIANEDYPQKNVPFALNDGRIFKEYCIKALGIKEKRVNIYENATGNNIIACVEKIKQIAEACDGDANIIFYYAGHAFPDEERSTGYLLPVDGDSKIASTGYSLEKLYKELSTVKTKSVICFIDACFSGATREDEMLLAGRGVAIKVKEEVPTGNIVVFSSATGAETAHQYEEKEHGMFTYFLLKKLQETKGDVTLGELSEYIIKNVKLTSVIENDKPQTPTVIPSQALQDKWQKIKL